nr:MAG TPA: hypothetical protein [Caudoviricetes sp.]
MKLPENMVYDKTTETVFVATPSDVVRFNRTQLGRAKTNLLNAQKRGDRKAVANIKRKTAIYQYTIDMAQRYIAEGEYIAKQITEAGD